MVNSKIILAEFFCTIGILKEAIFNATWVFSPVVIPLFKKLNSSMRGWVQFPGSSTIRVCEFRLEFLSYIKKIKNKKRGNI